MIQDIMEVAGVGRGKSNVGFLGHIIFRFRCPLRKEKSESQENVNKGSNKWEGKLENVIFTCGFMVFPCSVTPMQH